MTSPRYLVVALLMAVACDGNKDEPVAAAKPAPAPAALPEAPGVAFERATLDEGRIEAVIPSGWTSGAIPGLFRPNDSGDLGFMTKYSVGSTCDGVCAPKDWRAAADAELDRLTENPFEVDTDEALGDTGRLIVSRQDDRVYIAAAWWKDGASRYVYCRATLEDAAADAAEAFEQACRATRINW